MSWKASPGFPSDDAPVPDEDYRNALGIVIDTADRARISNQKYALCKELIKIDHHIEKDAYGDISWVEEERPSASEMIALLYEANSDRWKINQQAATYIYLGMVTDTGRFRFGGVNGETMRLAGLLLDQGIDTETLYAQLYLKDYESLKFRAYVYEHMHRTVNGAAYIYVDRNMQEQFGLSFEAACNVINYLEGIRDCLCCKLISEAGVPVETGVFRTHMQVSLVNDGPVTILLDSRKNF